PRRCPERALLVRTGIVAHRCVPGKRTYLGKREQEGLARGCVARGKGECRIDRDVRRANGLYPWFQVRRAPRCLIDSSNRAMLFSSRAILPRKPTCSCRGPSRSSPARGTGSSASPCVGRETSSAK